VTFFKDYSLVRTKPQLDDDKTVMEVVREGAAKPLLFSMNTTVM
jgi:hypothetical protein